MINLKDKKISSIYLGDKKINSVYLGSTQVYSSSRLPKEYQEVEYIESTGTQYINTGILANLNLKCYMKFKFNEIQTNLNTNIGVFGTQGIDQNSNAFAINSNTKKTYIFPQLDSKERTTIYNPDIVLNHIYETTLSKDGWYCDNILCATWNSPNQINNNKPITIFKLNAENYLLAKINLYSCKIYENDTLVRDFVPCYRKSDNEIGLYDLVNDVFYTNAGTGTFLKGGDV